MAALFRKYAFFSADAKIELTVLSNVFFNRDVPELRMNQELDWACATWINTINAEGFNFSTLVPKDRLFEQIADSFNAICPIRAEIRELIMNGSEIEEENNRYKRVFLTIVLDENYYNDSGNDSDSGDGSGSDSDEDE